MQEFHQFQWHSEENTVENAAPVYTAEVPQKKNRTWLVALVSAVVGAMVASFALPLTSSLFGTGSRVPFSFPEVGGSLPAEQVTYNPENRTELSTVQIGKLVGPAVVGISTVVETQGYSFSATAPLPNAREAAAASLLRRTAILSPITTL